MKNRAINYRGRNLTIKSNRVIRKISWHCTAVPSHKDFDGKNHDKLNESMRKSHMRYNGWRDIGQHFTIFPDGVIIKGRDLDLTPAVVAGHNSGMIGIEVLGNFDHGRDQITEEASTSLFLLTAALLHVHGLNSNDVSYHCWYTNKKTCPGTNFLGVGNSRQAYNQHVRPVLDRVMKLISG